MTESTDSVKSCVFFKKAGRKGNRKRKVQHHSSDEGVCVCVCVCGVFVCGQFLGSQKVYFCVQINLK